MPKPIDPALSFYNHRIDCDVHDAMAQKAVGRSSYLAEVVSPLNDTLLMRAEKIRQLQASVDYWKEQTKYWKDQAALAEAEVESLKKSAAATPRKSRISSTKKRGVK